MSQHEPQNEAAHVLAQLEQFMQLASTLHGRVTELESAVAYLLSKDPQWMASFNAMQAEEAKQNGGSDEQRSELVLPE